MARTNKQKTTDAQYAWVANGYVPDSRYQTMPHRTLTPAQYARALAAKTLGRIVTKAIPMDAQ